MKRGRKSSADLTVVAISGARVSPPEHLNAEQLAEWDAIVQSLPADYFRPADVHLLSVYVMAAVLYKRAAADIDRRGMYTTDERGRDFVNPAHAILTSQASAMAQMAVKLRLAPSSRYSDKSAATKQASAMGGRPWETGTE